MKNVFLTLIVTNTVHVRWHSLESPQRMYYEPLKRFQNCAGLAILHIAYERFSFHLAVDQERLFQNQFQVIQDQEPTRPLILIHLVQFTGQNVKLIRQWARIAQKKHKKSK